MTVLFFFQLMLLLLYRSKCFLVWFELLNFKLRKSNRLNFQFFELSYIIAIISCACSYNLEIIFNLFATYVVYAFLSVNFVFWITLPFSRTCSFYNPTDCQTHSVFFMIYQCVPVWTTFLTRTVRIEGVIWSMRIAVKPRFTHNWITAWFGDEPRRHVWPINSPRFQNFRVHTRTSSINTWKIRCITAHRSPRISSEMLSRVISFQY